MQDDLKFASEAITQIAMQAMKSIESLYANRNFDGSGNSKASKVSPMVSNLSLKVNTSSSSDVSNDPDYFDDPRFSIIEEPKVEKVEKPKVEKPKVEKVRRPPKYDSDLENLLL